MKNRRHMIITITASLIIAFMLAAACFADNNVSAAKGIEIIDVQKENFKGKLMVIQDPSKVFLGTVPEFGETQGMVVLDIIDTYRDNGFYITGGINGGAFTDSAPDSYTGQPVGIVISEGEILYMEEGKPEETFYLVGFTEEDRLILSEVTAEQVTDLDLRDAVCIDPLTSPFLIRNGKVLQDAFSAESDFGGGKNPRTAIGQREDGTVLFLVIDGRQTGSLGATVVELADCMLEYGAVTAAAMTGGTSSQMVYGDEVINTPYSPMGPRKCSTAWLIKE